MNNKIIECIPNISEGRRKDVIDKIANAVRNIEGVKLAHIDTGYAANRTVFTFFGEPAKVIKAAYNLIKTSSELIDMRKHKGEHPRIGATDVCPLVPVRGISLDETAKLARELAQRVGRDLSIPVYCYEAAASTAQRKNLANCRKGEYEGLQHKLLTNEWKPDYGPEKYSESTAKTGLTIIGARKFLIAYNINLNTKSVEIAKKIAYELRTIGYPNSKKSGLCNNLKGIGWYIEDFGFAQASFNITDYRTTPIHMVFEEAKKIADQLGAKVTGSELIGLIPLEAIKAVGKYYCKEPNLQETVLIDHAIENLGLNQIKSFDKNKRIIEYILQTGNNID